MLFTVVVIVAITIVATSPTTFTLASRKFWLELKQCPICNCLKIVDQESRKRKRKNHIETLVIRASMV